STEVAYSIDLSLFVNTLFQKNLINTQFINPKSISVIIVRKPTT
ncbi:MAG: hypothetical protein ACI90X_000379, partial [Oceanospirillaceae bacterium]